MAGNNSIQFLRGTSSQRASCTETSLAGQPIYETDTNKLYVGDGETGVDDLTAVRASAADSATNATHATTADSATDANNVKLTINGNAISEIFEDDGKTAKKATRATQDGSGNNILGTYATKATASQSASGLMSAADKIKLDSIPTNYWDAVEKGFITPSIGETKTIKIGANARKIQCIGLNHDDLVSGGKAKTTWQLVDHLTQRSMNSDRTNAGGWQNCDIRSWLNSTVLSSIKDEDGNPLSGKIKQVVKRAANGGSSGYSSIVSTDDYLFLPSMVEVFGTTYTNDSNQYAYAGEGNQYEFYSEALIPEPTSGIGQFIPLKEHSSKGTFYTSDTSVASNWIDKFGDAVNTTVNTRYNYNCTRGNKFSSQSLTRSAYRGATISFCVVFSARIGWEYADRGGGVSFCFCV